MGTDDASGGSDNAGSVKASGGGGSPAIIEGGAGGDVFDGSGTISTGFGSSAFPSSSGAPSVGEGVKEQTGLWDDGEGPTTSQWSKEDMKKFGDDIKGPHTFEW